MNERNVISKNNDRVTMFRNAIKTAMKYTFPIVMSRRNVANQCSASMGAFVVVNREGWIVTAAHIVNQLSSMAGEQELFKAYQLQVEQINSNQGLDFKTKKRALSKLAKPSPNQTQNWSAGGLFLIRMCN